MKQNQQTNIGERTWTINRLETLSGDDDEDDDASTRIVVVMNNDNNKFLKRTIMVVIKVAAAVAVVEYGTFPLVLYVSVSLIFMYLEKT